MAVQPQFRTADPDQRKHPGLWLCHPQPGDPIESRGHKLRPPPQRLPHARRRLAAVTQRSGGCISDEGLVAEQHGLGQWHQLADYLFSAHDPARAQPRRSVGLRDRSTAQRVPVEGRVVER